MNQLKLPFALIFTKIYFTIFNVFHLHVCIEGRPKRLKMDKILKWTIHNFYFLLLKHKSYILKWRYETKYLIFVFKIQYLYIKLRLFCIQPEWNGLNMIPMLLVIGRLFSAAGDILTSERNRLKPQTLEKFFKERRSSINQLQIFDVNYYCK